MTLARSRWVALRTLLVALACALLAVLLAPHRLAAQPMPQLDPQDPQALPPPPPPPPVPDPQQPAPQPAQPMPARVYPKEALALLPREVLDALPQLITAFLGPADYQALKGLCPETDPKAVLTCMVQGAGKSELELRLNVAVIDRVLGAMDAEIPKRLSLEDHKALAELCDKQAEKWAACTVPYGLGGKECHALEEEFSGCLSDNDGVEDLFVTIQNDKKAIVDKEIYVEIAGLLAQLDVDQTKELRAACPEDDAQAALACFEKQPVVGDMLKAFALISVAIVEEADREIRESGGGGLDKPKYTLVVLAVLLQMPIRVVTRLSNACEKEHPELAKARSVADVDAMLACILEVSHTDPVANPAFITREKLREWLELGRKKVLDKLRERDREAQMRSTAWIASILGIVAVLGALFTWLWGSLVLAKRFVAQAALVKRSSLVAAAMFLGTTLVLGVTLVVVRTGQGFVARDSSPTIKLANGAFDALAEADNVEWFSRLSKTRLDFIKRPLRDVIEHRGKASEAAAQSFVVHLATHWADLLEEPEVKIIAKNAKMLRTHAQSFRSAIGFYRQVSFVVELLPALLAILTVLLYLVPLREVLRDIATMPQRVASRAGGGSTAEVSARAKAVILGEIKLIVPFLCVVLVLLPLVGVLLGLVVKPLLEVIIVHVFFTLIYILLNEASAFAIYAGIGSAVLLLGLTVAVYVAAMSGFLGSVRRVLRSRFHDARPLRPHARFAGWGSAATLLVLLFPLVYALVVRWAYLSTHGFGVLTKRANHLGTDDMVLVPLVALLAFVPLFWAARGWRALQWVRKYAVEKGPAEPASVPSSLQPPSAQPPSAQPPSAQRYSAQPPSAQPWSGHPASGQGYAGQGPSQPPQSGQHPQTCRTCNRPLVPGAVRCMGCGAPVVR